MTKTVIIYRYRAPGASSEDHTDLTTDVRDLSPHELNISFNPVGERVTLQDDDPEDPDEGPKEYVVLERTFLYTSIAGSDPAPTLTITVTDSAE